MRRAVLFTAAVLLLAGCGSDEPEGPAAAVGGPSSAEQPIGDSGDLTDDQVTCLDAGEAVLEARVPPADAEPAPGRDILDLDRRVLTSLDTLDGLHALGDLASGIDRVMHTMGEMTALSGAESGRPWADRRTEFTTAIEQLQAACAAAGVPDFLNP